MLAILLKNGSFLDYRLHLTNFDGIAKLDGTGNSITQTDLKTLASKYGSDQMITYGDIRSINQDVLA